MLPQTISAIQATSSQIDAVALWAGLLGSVVAIVLSVVAMLFTWVVNKRSDKISDHTIQSLQKIESSVATLSDNSNQLIKAAWDKMLGSVGSNAETVSESADSASQLKELAAGIAAEIRSELAAGEEAKEKGVAPERLDQLETSLERLEKTVRASMEARKRPSTAIDQLLPQLADLTPEARQLLYAIRPRHLTKDQYKRLLSSQLSPAVNELRDRGFLAAFQGIEDGKKVPVYYLGQGLKRTIEPAFLLLEPPNPSVAELVNSELRKAGYKYV